MLDLNKLSAYYAPQCADSEDDEDDCPRCHAGVAVDFDAGEWSAENGDYCDTCEREIARQAREDVPVLIAALAAARVERDEALDKLRVCEEHCALAEREAAAERARADRNADMLDEASPALDYGKSGHRLRFEGCDCIRCRIERGEHRRA